MQSSSPSSSQLQRESYGANQQQIGGFPNMNLQTLESYFGRLSMFDSSAGPEPNNQGTNRLHGEIAESPHQLPFQNDLINRSYRFHDANAAQTSPSTSQMLNLNGNLRDVPYFSRYPSLTNGSGSGISNNSWRTNQGFAYNSVESSIVWLAIDRTSYKLLQHKIASGSKETVDFIFSQVIFHIADLMVDPFGHHVIQKLMEKCSSQQITQILLMITKHHSLFVTICIDSLGTRAIQSLLKYLHSEDQIQRIVGVISIETLTLTKSNNAKHVILQCFKQFSPSQNRNLLEVIARHCYRIATDQHGCCMLQQCLGLSCGELKHRLIAEIIANALKLCVDCYGNYVVQYVLELEDPHVTCELVGQLVGYYGYLSRNKYGSHAVQKFLKIDYIDSRVIVYDLLREIDTLLLDPFGNYVIQTAWSVSKDEMRNILWCHIKNKRNLMCYNKFGRKLLEILDL